MNLGLASSQTLGPTEPRVNPPVMIRLENPVPLLEQRLPRVPYLAKIDAGLAGCVSGCGEEAPRNVAQHPSTAAAAAAARPRSTAHAATAASRRADSGGARGCMAANTPSPSSLGAIKLGFGSSWINETLMGHIETIVPPPSI